MTWTLFIAVIITMAIVTGEVWVALLLFIFGGAIWFLDSCNVFDRNDSNETPDTPAPDPDYENNLDLRVRELSEECRIALENEANAVVSAHMPTLSRKYRSLVYEDDFGISKTEAWDKEFEYFFINLIDPIIHKYSEILDRKLKSSLTFDEWSMVTASFSRDSFLMNLQTGTETLIEESTPADDFLRKIPSNPIEFEQFCADLIRQQGWKAIKTKSSGDQGADIVAHKNNISIIIQCKHHAKNIGNKAVQEAYAARTHYMADYAIVVSSSGYTKSARQLSKTTNVILASVADLPNIDALIQS